MLNERQRKVVIVKVNEDVNIPIMSENREGKLIEKFVDRVMPKVEPSLLAIMPGVYVRCIKLALNEDFSIKERREKIATLLRAELSEPLSKQLNERVDCSIVPEKWEGKVLAVVANKIIDEFVEWTVGEIDEKFKLEVDAKVAASEATT